jgi:hypothetical protein
MHDLQVDLTPGITKLGDFVGTGVFGHVNPFYGSTGTKLSVTSGR